MARKRSKQTLAQRKANPNSLYYKSRCDDEWKLYIKMDAHFECAICGSKSKLNAHHHIDRSNVETRHAFWNGTALCPGCHKFAVNSAHKNGVWFADWLRKNRNTKYRLTVDYKYKLHDPKEKWDYKARYAYLHRVVKDMKKHYKPLTKRRKLNK